VDAAFSYLQHAITFNDRAGLAAHAIQSQVDLSQLLLTEPAVRDAARAHSLLEAANVSAKERGLSPLLRNIEDIRRRYDTPSE